MARRIGEDGKGVAVSVRIPEKILKQIEWTYGSVKDFIILKYEREFKRGERPAIVIKKEKPEEITVDDF